MPAEQLTSQPYEKEPSSPSELQTGVQLDFHTSHLGTANEGLVDAAAHVAAIRAAAPEQLTVTDYEKQLRERLRMLGIGVVNHLRSDKLAEQEVALSQQGYEQTERS